MPQLPDCGPVKGRTNPKWVGLEPSAFPQLNPPVFLSQVDADEEIRKAREKLNDEMAQKEAEADVSAVGVVRFFWKSSVFSCGRRKGKQRSNHENRKPRYLKTHLAVGDWDLGGPNGLGGFPSLASYRSASLGTSIGLNLSKNP